MYTGEQLTEQGDRNPSGISVQYADASLLNFNANLQDPTYPSEHPHTPNPLTPRHPTPSLRHRPFPATRPRPGVG